MILACYDIVGIQKFIFASNRVKENIGASRIVDQALSDWLPEVIRSQVQNHHLDWENEDYSEDLVGTEGAIVLYIGGGNAMVLYDGQETYLKVNRALSEKLLHYTEGELGFASAWVECSTNRRDDIAAMLMKMTLVKSTRVPSTPQPGIGITREGETDGLPAVHHYDGRYLSQSARQKIEFSGTAEALKRLLPSGLEYTTQFDDLGMVEAQNFIAVVHIDGNDMGKCLRDILSGSPGQNPVMALRKFSKDTDAAYKHAFREVLEELYSCYRSAEFWKMFNLTEGQLIIRPIVLNGDDVTFVTDGRLGIALAVAILEKIGKISIEVNGQDRKLSACAGVAIVKAHYPFYRAYELAEQLCVSAKEKAKRINIDNPGNWIDWDIAQNAALNSLREMREKQYIVPGRADGNNLGIQEYNLLWRPWKLDGGRDKGLEELMRIKNMFSEMPRSKMKALRNICIQGKEATMEYVGELRSRGLNLPDFLGSSNEFFFEDRTPYFDALESDEYLRQLDEFLPKE